MVGINGSSSNGAHPRVGTAAVKQGLAQMLKGGVIVSLMSCGFRATCLNWMGMWNRTSL
jgi:hypothetical protein